MDGMDKLERAVRDDAELSGRVRLIYRNPPPKNYGKDYNEFLLANMRAERLQNEKAAKRRARTDAIAEI